MKKQEEKMSLTSHRCSWWTAFTFPRAGSRWNPACHVEREENMPEYLQTGLHTSNSPHHKDNCWERTSNANTHRWIIYQNILFSWTTIQYVTEKSQRDLRQVWLRFSSMWVLFETISAAEIKQVKRKKRTSLHPSNNTNNEDKTQRNKKPRRHQKSHP